MCRKGISVSADDYGRTKAGEAVGRFTISDGGGMTVRCINYGARITGIVLPTAEGETDVIQGFDDLAGYEADTAFFGAIVGRYANRIKDAKFELGGKIYSLTKNDGENYLHGSFSRRVFNAEAVADGVVFTYASPDGEDGFPGNMIARVKYSLDGENRLTMEYSATTDAETVVNLTNHAYFDLSDGRDADIASHVLQLSASKFLEIGPDLCPTGRIVDVAGTPFDFTAAKPIGMDIDGDDPQLTTAGGYDHCFVIDGYDGSLRHAATVSRGNISMKVFTTQPGIQLYTGNALDGATSGKGMQHARRSALCLETQHYPDSPNRPTFPSTRLESGGEYLQTTVLEFGY